METPGTSCSCEYNYETISITNCDSKCFTMFIYHLIMSETHNFFIIHGKYILVSLHQNTKRTTNPFGGSKFIVHQMKLIASTDITCLRPACV